MGNGLIVRSICETPAREDDDILYSGYDVAMTVSSVLADTSKLDYGSAITSITFRNMHELRNRKIEKGSFDLSTPEIHIAATVGCIDISEASDAARQALVSFAEYLLSACGE